MSEQHPSGPLPGPVPPAAPLSHPGPGQPVPVGPLAAMPPPGYDYRYPDPPADPLPAPGTEYAQFLRTGRNRWWKGLVVIVLLVVGYVLVSFVTGLGAIGIDLATGRIDQESLLQGRVTITPALLLSINLSAATMIPLSMLLQWGFYGQPVRWIHSVLGHLRWDLLGRVALIIVPVWVAYVALSIFVFPAPPSGAFTAESVALLAVVLLTTPLQAAGEEYGARGLITRAAGSWSANARLSLVISTVVSAVIFTLAHGAADLWLIAYYLLFGVSMSIVVWRTGGLEAAVLIHTVNNVFLFAVAITSGQDLGAGLDRSAGTGGTFMLIPMLLLVIIAGVLWRWSDRNAVDRRYAPKPAAP
jgi:membrane protease YdiL (CAAX protease family)